MNADTTYEECTQQASRIMKYNQSMLKNAEAGEWDKVMEEELVCRKLVNQLYSIPERTPNIPGIKNVTHEILITNEKITQLAIDAKEKIGVGASAIGNGRRAVSAYSNNSR